MSEKTRTLSSEETGRLDQPDGCEEGPFINRQGVSAEELGDGLGNGKGQPGQWGCGWAESGRIRGTVGPAVGPAAKRIKGGCLTASTGTASTDPEGRKAGRVSHVGNPDDLRQGVPASVAQSVGTDLRAGVRRSQLRISARAVDKGCPAQSLERDDGWEGVDCGRRSEGFLRVGGSGETSHARSPESSRWPSAVPH